MRFKKKKKNQNIFLILRQPKLTYNLLMCRWYVIKDSRKSKIT